MVSTPPSSPAASRGVCTFCGLGYTGRPNQCTRCGALLNDAAGDAKRIGQENRKHTHIRRALADVLFLVGLLLGGPMMTIGGDVRTGLFIVLAGGFASVLRRYTDWSAPGTVIVGSVGAAIVAASLVDSAQELEATLAHSEARGAFAEALASPERDIFVEARGPGLITIWFTVPGDLTGECGDYPPEEIRAHLGDLGFARIVVAQPNRSGGLCSFAP